MSDATWLDRYPEAKALLQRPDDELLYTPRHVGLPEDHEPVPSWAEEVRAWQEDDI
jgi:hypothetical protein